jgi:hypothetical protein
MDFEALRDRAQQELSKLAHLIAGGLTRQERARVVAMRRIRDAAYDLDFYKDAVEELLLDRPPE